MEKINGAMLSQVAVALVAMDFDDELSKEWIKYIGSSEDLPTIKNFVAFATPLTQFLDYNPGQRFNYCETKQRMC